MTRNRQIVRQLALVRELMRAGRAGQPLAYLADALGVTARTIRRDVAVLESAHLPVMVGRRDEDGVTVFGLMAGAPCPACGRSARAA